MPTYLRTTETWERYVEGKKREDCFICAGDLMVTEWEHWVIVENAYPYDAVADTHVLLCPRRHVSREEDLQHQEFRELQVILRHIEKAGYFDFIGKNFPVAQSQPAHLHYHLFHWKRK